MDMTQKETLKLALKRNMILLLVLPPEHEFCKLVEEFAVSDAKSDISKVIDHWADEDKNDLIKRLDKTVNAVVDYLKEEKKKKENNEESIGLINFQSEDKKIIKTALKRIMVLLTVLPPDNFFCKVVKQCATSDLDKTVNAAFDFINQENTTNKEDIGLVQWMLEEMMNESNE